MKNKTQTLLPGLKAQYRFLRENISGVHENILVIGSSSEWIAIELAGMTGKEVHLIVEDYESLLNSKLVLESEPSIKVTLMSYETTDFDSESFDLIYAQASISLTNRNKIVKEIKRILKPCGVFCVGEIVSLKKESPAFITDIYDTSNLLPLYIEDIDKYYTERKFEILARKDLSETLSEYYQQSYALLKDKKDELTDSEKSYYKKILHKVSHESNVYLKLGGDKFIGFISLLLRKEEK
jgi:ubiquinone/menaquinone biosynthesis C-methylase UbiE